MFTFNVRSFLIALALFTVEVFIALFVRDRFVRPYVGDFLVVIMIYYAVKSFFKIPPLKLATGVLLFSYLVETLQYFRIVDKLGLTRNIVAKTVIGYGFEWLDILAYTLGIVFVVVVEKVSSAGTGHKIVTHGDNRR
jgi:hypothetical protein